MATDENKTSDEAQIRNAINDFAKAFRTQNINLMMSLYAPEFVAFDIVPPMQTTERGAYKKAWEQAFSLFKNPIDIEIRDLNITAGADVAFSHQLLRLHATMTIGQTVDYWERLTFCFGKMDNKWLILHEHVSVPV